MNFMPCVAGQSWPRRYRILAIMKLAIFFSVMLSFHAFAESKAQKISLQAHNTTLSEVMREIQKQQGYSFFFRGRSEEHTSELQSLMRNSYAVFCLKKKK